MVAARQIVRIFISSPGDVVEERNQARRVIADLERRYPEVTLQPLLWEELALPATASFQESIDFILNREPIDIAVFILWSRLGTPLGAARTRPDGTPYRSGTEREFDLMLAAFEQSGKQRPFILAYARDDVDGFKQKLNESDDSQWEELINQRKLAEAFIRERFFDSEGRNTRALQNYREPVGFADRLRAHLKHSLDDALGSDAAPRWEGEPYRGLEAFDVDHEMIFHGRDEETCELLERLRDQDRAGCAFVVIVGASGSGKSSLARAGVAASLLRHAGDDSVKVWKTASFVPSLGGADLCTALLEALYQAIPELETTGSATEDIADGLRTEPTLTFRLTLAPAFAQAATTAKGAVRVLLVLDQLEELWTDRHITAENRTVFFVALDALARSGHVSVLATLRSDFYPHAQAVPAFLDLKGDRGHFDLRPPSVDALRQLITEPARLAGLQFERHEQTGRSLDQDILQDAAHDPGALPLLQYTLAALDSQRDGASRLLTFASYEALGGVEGAIGTRADAMFQGLDEATRVALNEILPLLVTIDVAGEQAAVRQRAPLTELRDTPSRRQLTDSLIAARFLATDRQGGQPVASLAHEALLRRWDRIAEWIAANREHLRLRARVEQNQQRWVQQDRDDSLLLSAGLPLEEGRQLLTDAAHLLSLQTADYIRSAIDYHARQAHSARQQRRAVLKKALVAREKAVALAEQAERNAYNSDMLLAQRDWEGGNIGHLRELLERHRNRDDLKGFEWGYWDRLVNSALLTLRGHSRPITCVSFSPDGKRIVSGSDDATLRVWDAATGQETLALEGHTSYVLSVSFSPDGKRIVSGSDDATLKVWDATTGQMELTVKGHESYVSSVGFSPDGTQIVSGSMDRTIKLWDAVNGRESLTLTGHDDRIGHTFFVNGVSFSPDGTRIVSGSNGKTLKVWDAETGSETLTLKGHTDSVTCVSFSPDGTRILSGSWDETIKLWDATTGRETLTLKGHTGGVTSVSFSPDGKRIVSDSNDATLKVWDAATGREILTLKGHEGGVTCVSFSPDGTRIVSGSDDATLKVWDAATGQETRTLKGHDNYVLSVSFSPDGMRIVSGSDDATLKMWDATTGRETLTLKGHESYVSSVSFSPDGKRVVSGSWDTTIKLWNAASGQEMLTLKGHHDRFGHTSFVNSVAFSSDGKWIVTGSNGQTVKIWDAETGCETQTLSGHTDSVTSVAFSPDGTRIVSGSWDATAKIWDVDTGQERLTLKGHEGGISSVSFSPDGKRIVSGSWDNTLKLWDADSGQATLTLKGHTDDVNSVSFSPDGKRIVSGSGDATVKLWDPETGQERLTLKGPQSPFLSVGFSPDGSQIVSGSTDQTIKVWDARPWSAEQTTRFGAGQDTHTGAPDAFESEATQQPPADI